MPKKQKKSIDNSKGTENTRYIELVKLVKKNNEKANEAFEEIVDKIDPKIRRLISRMKIPGLQQTDIYQEALFALRFKAIRDFRVNKGKKTELAIFDNFAILCIRRHLSTKLRVSYQNKQRAQNNATSIHKPVNFSGSEDENLVLSDIIPGEKRSILNLFENAENFANLISSLWEKLSSFEKKVFLLYSKDLSYKEILEEINRNVHGERHEEKSIDNALSRIKMKAKIAKEKYDED
jgi:RNA polymerase sporulation-specific sigma factor